jgi:hypothetical protein
VLLLSFVLKAHVVLRDVTVFVGICSCNEVFMLLFFRKLN